MFDLTPAESHWCAPSKGLHGAQDMVEHPAGRRSSLRRPIPQERGDLNRLRRDAAQLYALRAQKVERLEAYRRDHAEQLRLFEAAQPVATPEQLGLPPLTSPKPTTTHERTATCDCHDCAKILATYRDNERRILFLPKSRGSILPRRPH